MGVYIVNMVTNPLANMPDDCYGWGTLVMLRSTDSYLLVYAENNQNQTIWVTNQWGASSPLQWRAL